MLLPTILRSTHKEHVFTASFTFTLPLSRTANLPRPSTLPSPRRWPTSDLKSGSPGVRPTSAGVAKTRPESCCQLLFSLIFRYALGPLLCLDVWMEAWIGIYYVRMFGCSYTVTLGGP